jgi:hypothetical protein
MRVQLKEMKAQVQNKGVLNIILIALNLVNHQIDLYQELLVLYLLEARLIVMSVKVK